jgi:hypothetical protein
MRFLAKKLIPLVAIAGGLTLALAAIAGPTSAPSNMIKDATLDHLDSDDGWQASSLENASVSIAKDSTDPNHPALKATIDKVDGADWHAQIFQSGFSVQKDAKYTLTFIAKASAARKMAVFIQQASDPYNLLTEGKTIDLKTDAATQTVQFTATDNSDDAKLTIAVGDATGTVTLSDVSLVKD